MLKLSILKAWISGTLTYDKVKEDFIAFEKEHPNKRGPEKNNKRTVVVKVIEEVKGEDEIALIATCSEILQDIQKS